MGLCPAGTRVSAAFSQRQRCCCCCRRHMKRMYVSFTAGSEWWEARPDTYLNRAITGKQNAPSPHVHMTLTLPVWGWGSRDAEQFICSFHALEWVSGRPPYYLSNSDFQMLLQRVWLQLTPSDTHTAKYQPHTTTHKTGEYVKSLQLQKPFDFIRVCRGRRCCREPLPVRGEVSLLPAPAETKGSPLDGFQPNVSVKTAGDLCDESVSQKCQAESCNWFRWEGLVLGSNRVLFYVRAPVNTTEPEDVDD